MGVFSQFVPDTQGSFTPYDFLPNERLQLIVIGFDHHYKYKEELALKQKEVEQEAMAFGEQVKLLNGDSRKAGLAVKCVVLARSNAPDAPAMNVVCNKDTPQSDIIELTFNIPNPEFIYLNSRWEFQYGIDTDILRKGVPSFNALFPPISECGQKITTPDGDKKVKFSQMSDAQKAMYPSVAVDEAKRKSMWKALIEWWNTQSQENASQFMKQLAAQWLGIVNKDEMGNYTTLKPEIGTIFEIGISGPNYPAPAIYRFSDKKFNLGFYLMSEPKKAEHLANILDTEIMEKDAW